ncbi:phosphoribosyltransferase family protein [Marinospirillum alkaliphilum]|uniref:Adenine phosphoribosyltransferase n=1 Tax=Marinospirillum alkaliphilum DSM 21637 TaxID=1122209 RepID=A0A1K1VFC3_9GAMM|nr:phosphoribosyltransferase family protein [Marinospirillum alkaliphilum]SFX23856.1 adenine phosphoribosyltransferase [Marinospirillum alkaliphilum DSM 21637]
MLDDFPLKQLIHVHRDFPRKGYNTRDLSRLLSEPRALQTITDTFAHRYVDAPLTHLVALKGRGTMFAAVLAYRLNLPLILIRDLGEEPGEVLHERAPSSSGDRTLEMRQGLLDESSCVLLFDDLLSSGASLIAATTLIRRQQARVHEVATLIDLPDHGGSQRLQAMDVSTYALMAFEGD